MPTAPVIVITGASQGIGAAIAREFAAGVPRARLALVARNPRSLAAVARACRRRGARAEVFPCDVASAPAVADMAAAVLACFGRVDVLVNNAGKFAGAPFATLGLEQFDELVAVNLRSVFLVSKAFVPGMVRRRRGDVFTMSSIAGLSAYPGGAGYCATVSPSWQGSGVDPRRMMPAEDVARAFLALYRMTRRTVVEEIVLRPQLGDL
jgi:NADP-dependent 3-hydroxy acid dehydrogenase YdfG